MNLGVTFQTTSRNFKRAPFPWARINDVHKRDMGTENALAIDPRQTEPFAVLLDVETDHVNPHLTII